MKKTTIKVLGMLLIFLLGSATTIDNNSNRHFEILKNLEIFSNLYKEVNTYYVDEIDPGQFMRTGIDAMVKSLDPYTNYYSEADIEGYRIMTEGKYHGIGAKSDIIDGYVTIMGLNKDQPADKAGLKVGDQILEVDGKDAKGKTMDEFNQIARGFPGTTMHLKIKREGEVRPLDIELVREEVKVENVPFHGIIGNDDIAYISLTTFTRDAGKNIETAIKDLRKKNDHLKGIVLDLRDNGGGLLNEAVNIVNLFVPKGEIVVSTRGKIKEWNRDFKTAKPPYDLDIPVTVLINGRSASASEIVSGVMQDYDRGVLIGRQSYGKGLVQNTMDIGYNSKVKVTTAKYYIPSQRCIQAIEYKNGEPVHIPEDQRMPFKTRNGRTVYDGGGIKPDVLVDSGMSSKIVKSLIKDHQIFKFVTNYCSQGLVINDIENYHFTDFDAFMSFLERENFDFNLDSDQSLTKFKEQAKEDGFELGGALSNLEKEIIDAKKREILKYKSTIVNLIEKDIAGRYFYEEGKIKMGLRNDEEVKKAIEILHDSATYNRLLGK